MTLSIIEQIINFLQWNLSSAGKIAGFKTLVISKIVRLALVKVLPISTIIELNNGNLNGNPKIKQGAYCKDYENGGLKKFTMFLV